MKSIADELLQTTLALVAAAETMDVETCLELLERRNRLTVDLAALRDENHAAASTEISSILTRIHQFDTDLAARWQEEKDRLGRELVRIKQREKKHGSEKPCIVNRRA